MNLADILIMVCFLAFLVRGVELGLVQQSFSTSGFIGGLFAGGFVQHHFVQNIQDENSRAIFSLLIVLAVALLGLFIGELIGGALRWRLRAIDRFWVSRIDKIGGSIIAGATLIVFIWLTSGLLAGVPDQSVRSHVKDSVIINHITQTLPDAPRTLSRISKLINPNGFPKVFIGREPAIDATTPLPDLGNLQAGVEATRPSVVKISGRGCGGMVTGSGFIAQPGTVITNAHVVAGVRQPLVVDGAGSREATVIWFNPDLDIAILTANGLTGKPLPMISEPAADGTLSAALGFPGGGEFTASPSNVLDSFTATGRTIYEQGTTVRSVYSLRSTINSGNSGGPLINSSGAVIGVIFAKSATYEQVGYALTMPAVLHDLAKAQAGSGKAVDTGSCSAA